jgi:hypothetical protein
LDRCIKQPGTSGVYEPEIIAPAGQAFYVIKSISPKTGIFNRYF